ncbi:patatin-like phospholipase family protein [Bdellovibrio bacteriovorus]|uniref:patatin-like phospholipase family protein n=1 Tax=Bdellovibrio bacteriovorus TaxID=959 RepID=UPI0021D2095E|nr:patatin-like phospholipase family protein [Bdellovibrio bacteriovorus]UXR63540.1 patatin-like phospholipase family protein [Bdellovibrio bacteriovorus]
MSSLGLVLSGGGARGAFQVGVLNAIADICKQEGIANPFQLYTGISAGAINTAFLTTSSHDHFDEGTRRLTELWSQISSEQVFITDPISLSKGGLHWLLALSLGGLKDSSPNRSFLETTPLRKLIAENCNFENIQKNIEKKKFRAVTVSALDYFTTSTVSFVQGEEKTPLWKRVRKMAVNTQLTADHIMASAAIPLLFPPVTVDGQFFGDGCIRNHSPCAPAIYLGANKLLAIGIRKRQDVCYASQKVNTTEPPSVARVLSVMLNAVMMDGLEVDIERLERINSNLSKLTERELGLISVRKVDYLWISPSRDLSEIASDKTHSLPPMIRYLLRGLGTLHEASEITSFLLFEKTYSERLLEIGYEDGMREKEQIRRLLLEP